jgi:hypothetical protein
MSIEGDKILVAFVCSSIKITEKKLRKQPFFAIAISNNNNNNSKTHHH